MSKKLMVLTALVVWLIAPVSAIAKPAVTIMTISEKEVEEIIDGREVKSRIVTSEIEPGETLIFTMKYANKGDERAINVVIGNPIPKDSIYVVGSASGIGSEIEFSIDDGKTFNLPSLLTYEVNNPSGEQIQMTASPEQYTNIRWTVKEIPAGQQGEVSFRIRLK
ncbi:MAG: hypothetical protein ABFS18_03740 [Thermodesulfobacteriota bacterium]